MSRATTAEADRGSGQRVLTEGVVRRIVREEITDKGLGVANIVLDELQRLGLSPLAAPREWDKGPPPPPPRALLALLPDEVFEIEHALRNHRAWLEGDRGDGKSHGDPDRFTRIDGLLRYLDAAMDDDYEFRRRGSVLANHG